MLLNNCKYIEDTIVAICTPIGIGSICAIRVSGLDSVKIVNRIFESASGGDLLTLDGYQAKYGYLIDKNNKKIDEVVVLVFKAPRSYTGEDVVEIFCHGGIIVCKESLDAIINSGARLSQPGEFTKRAFLNNKMSLDKAEAVEEIISSEFEFSKNLSFSNFNGNIGKEIEKIKTDLIEILTNVNVRLDYPEDDFEKFTNKDLKNKIESVIFIINKLKSTFETGKIIKNGINAVILGAPNTGKSSLMNFLSKREKSIVTDIPGTTRDAIEEHILIGNIPVNLIDTAGIRDTDEIIEKIGTEKALEIAKSADVIFMLFDSSNKLSENEIKILKKFNKNKIIAIFNKIDLKNNEDLEINTMQIKNLVFSIVNISVKENLGFDDLNSKLYEFLGVSSFKSENLIITNKRQFEILNTAYITCKEALDACDIGWDIVSVTLEESIKNLDQFYGKNVNETIVDEIFSKFCLGK